MTELEKLEAGLEKTSTVIMEKKFLSEIISPVTII